MKLLLGNFLLFQEIVVNLSCHVIVSTIIRCCSVSSFYLLSPTTSASFIIHYLPHVIQNINCSLFTFSLFFSYLWLYKHFLEFTLETWRTKEIFCRSRTL